MHLLYGSQTDAKALLNQLNVIAAILNLRIVLWIEDLERFIGITQMNETDHQLTEDARRQLAPLHALVDLLGKKPPEGQSHTIGPVFATTRLQTAFDFKRIADYVEELEVVNVEKAARLFSKTEDLLVTRKWRIELIDPASPSTREPNERLNRWTEELEAVTTILNIAGFPIRQIKSSLRRALEYWERYPGEVDPHDLLLLKLIKEQNEGAKLIDKLLGYRGLEPATEHDSPDQPNTVSTLACAFGFPKKDHGAPSIKPQGARLNHNIYWQRIMAEPDISEKESDQNRYRKIKNAAQTGNPEVLSKILDEYHSGEVLLNQEDKLFGKYPFLKEIWPPMDSQNTNF